MTTPPPPRDVAVVCPTFREGESIATFLERVQAAASRFTSARLTELIFVDDGSTDGTVERIEEAARTWATPRVILIERAQRGGSVSAQIAGFQRASAPIVVTMDADGQHPPETIDRLVEEAGRGDPDLVVASRHVPGGGVRWADGRRGVISAGARWMAQALLPGARSVTDPLSGFFLARREWVADLPSAPPGYKILLYVLAMHPRGTFREIPFEMGVRIAGESKLIQGVGYMSRYLRELGRYLLRAGAVAR